MASVMARAMAKHGSPRSLRTQVRVLDLLHLLDVVPTKLTGWVGLDNMIVEFCEWSGILVTMLVLPIVSVTITVLLIAKAESLIKLPFTDKLNTAG